MNRHLETMKTAIANYHSKAKTAEAKIKKIVEEYKPDVARERVAAVQADLVGTKAQALDTIRAAQQRGAEEYASKWETVRGEDITPDAKLLETGISMTQGQFDALCMKYTRAGNNTMCKLLADYAEQNNKRRAAEHPGQLFPVGYLTTRELPVPEENAKEWERAARSAERIVNQISGSGWMQGPNDAIVISSVERFGENIEV